MLPLFLCTGRATPCAGSSHDPALRSKHSVNGARQGRCCGPVSSLVPLCSLIVPLSTLAVQLSILVVASPWQYPCPLYQYLCVTLSISTYMGPILSLGVRVCDTPLRIEVRVIIRRGDLFLYTQADSNRVSRRERMSSKDRVRVIMRSPVCTRGSGFFTEHSPSWALLSTLLRRKYNAPKLSSPLRRKYNAPKSSFSAASAAPGHVTVS